MPSRILGRCAYPSCGARTAGKFCPDHSPDERATAAQRGYDASWRSLRRMKLNAYPLCEVCQREQRLTPATEVHHDKPIATHPELRLVWANLVSICRACHQRIEAQRRGTSTSPTSNAGTAPQAFARDRASGQGGSHA